MDARPKLAELLLMIQLGLLSFFPVCLRFGLTDSQAGVSQPILGLLSATGWAYVICTVFIASVGATQTKFRAFFIVSAYLIIGVFPILAQFPSIGTWDYFTHGSLAQEITRTGQIDIRYAYAAWPGTHLTFALFHQITGFPLLISLISVAVISNLLAIGGIYIFAKSLGMSGPSITVLAWILLSSLTGPVIQLDASPQLVNYALFLIAISLALRKTYTRTTFSFGLLFFAMAVSHPITSFVMMTILIVLFLTKGVTGLGFGASIVLTSITVEAAWTTLVAFSEQAAPAGFLYSLFQQVNLSSLGSGVVPSAFTLAVEPLNRFFSLYRTSLILGGGTLGLIGIIWSRKSRATKRLVLFAFGAGVGIVPLAATTFLLQRLELFEVVFVAIASIAGVIKIAGAARSRFSLTWAPSTTKVVTVVALTSLLLLTFVNTYTPPTGGPASYFVQPPDLAAPAFISTHCDCAISTDPISIILYRFYVGQTIPTTPWDGSGGTATALRAFELGSNVILFSPVRLIYYSADPNEIGRTLDSGVDRIYSSGISTVYDLQK
jgi:hypothetical protein